MMSLVGWLCLMFCCLCVCVWGGGGGGGGGSCWGFACFLLLFFFALDLLVLKCYKHNSFSLSVPCHISNTIQLPWQSYEMQKHIMSERLIQNECALPTDHVQWVSLPFCVLSLCPQMSMIYREPKLSKMRPSLNFLGQCKTHSQPCSFLLSFRFCLSICGSWFWFVKTTSGSFWECALFALFVCFVCLFLLLFVFVF